MPDATVWLLAAVLAGEAGVLPDAMPLIGHCVLNRVDSADFPDTVIDVLVQEGQWNGWADPTALSVYWAKRALRRKRDETGGVLFVLSGDDRRNLGCDVGDIIYVGDQWSVHGYYEWCAK